MGAKFGKSQMQISMGIENEMYNDWERWSRQMVFEQTSRVAAFEGTVAREEDDALRDNILDEALPLQRPGGGRPTIGSDVFAQQAQLDSRHQRRPESL